MSYSVDVETNSDSIRSLSDIIGSIQIKSLRWLQRLSLLAVIPLVAKLVMLLLKSNG